MLVMVLETVPVGLRGELTRWLIEPHPGVFVGHVSGMVRDRLWAKCCKDLRGGGVVQIWSMNNEQRFAIRSFGTTKRQVVDYEGLQLIRLPAESDSIAPAHQNRRRSSATEASSH